MGRIGFQGYYGQITWYWGRGTICKNGVECEVAIIISCIGYMHCQFVTLLARGPIATWDLHAKRGMMHLSDA